jgi:FkbM family methyltransferase
MALLGALRFYSGLSRAFGPGVMASMALRRKLGLKSEMSARWNGRRLYVRPFESDPILASSILGYGEYRMRAAVQDGLSRLAALWRSEGSTPVIIDGGANVGFAALYFASAFPETVILAVEPSEVSIGMLKRNCAGMEAIRPIHGAIWSGREGVSLKSEPGECWGDHVEAGGLIPSMRLEDLIAMIPNARPLIIKLDIEGAEREVCAASRDVLRQAACLVIEPHDWLRPGGGCLSPLYDALQGREMDTFLLGENLVLIESGVVRAGSAAPAESLPAEPASKATVS